MNHLPKLIALCGAAGAGKDTVALYLDGEHGYNAAAFAAPIRNMVTELLYCAGVDLRYTEDRTLKEQPLPGIGQSYRALAQTLGTEWGRAIDADLWVKVMQGYMALQDAEERFVITDLRFPNEWAWVRSQGGVIWRVMRQDAPAVRAHVSETALDNDDEFQPDALLFNDGSVEQLHAGIEALLHDPVRSAA